MCDVKELNEKEFEKVTGGAVDYSSAKYKNGDLFYRNDGLFFTYSKITDFGSDPNNLTYKYKSIKTYVSGGDSIISDGSISESQLDINYIKIDSVPSYISFD